ncbi:hypothetical protein AAH994_07965 [Weeksellaceae bacterium A-14]|uniref:hypothetical protein n=1 Tax=Daejeonia sp. YH14 TaxID=3439042 RepID=UPI0031E4C2CA
MTKYILPSRRKTVTLPCDKDFVTWMRRNDVQHWENNRDFMEEYAHRKILFEKITLRHDSEAHFTEDLIRSGLLRTEPSERRFWKIFG